MSRSRARAAVLLAAVASALCLGYVAGLDAAQRPLDILKVATDKQTALSAVERRAGDDP